MKLRTLSKNICDTVFIDDATGAVMYRVTTPRKCGKRTTTMYDAQGHVIAVYQRRWGRDRVTFHGHMYLLREWLPKKGWSG